MSLRFAVVETDIGRIGSVGEGLRYGLGFVGWYGFERMEVIIERDREGMSCLA